MPDLGADILEGGPVDNVGAMTPCIGRMLRGFQYKAARKLTGRQPRRGRDGVWVYPPLEESIEEAGLKEVET